MYMVIWKEPDGNMRNLSAHVGEDMIPWFDREAEAEAAARNYAERYPEDIVEIREFAWIGGPTVVPAPPDPMIELRQRIIALAVEMGVWSKVEYIENYNALHLENENGNDIGIRFERRS